MSKNASRARQRAYHVLQAGLVLVGAGCVGEPRTLCVGTACGGTVVPESVLPACAFGEQPRATCQADRTLGVFLSPKGGDDGDGTVNRPFRTFARALRDERLKKNGQLFACMGEFSEPVRAADLKQLAIIGGFDCATWAPSAGITRVFAAEQVGLALRRVPAVHLYDLEIRTNDAPPGEAGVSRVGMALTDVAAASLARLSVRAGAGSPGARGSEPAPNPGTSYGAPYEVRICADGSWSAGAAAEHATPPISTDRGTSSTRSFVDERDVSGRDAKKAFFPADPVLRGFAGANGSAGVAAPLDPSLGVFDADRNVWKAPDVFWGSMGNPGGGSGRDGLERASNAGSCGGGGGGGGAQGGHSIGIYLAGTPAALRDVRIESSAAGAGGAGAAGAAGEAYAGATPGGRTNDMAGVGGGGGGGAGGNGGNGGISVGIFWVQRAPSVGGVTVTTQDTATWFSGPKTPTSGGEPGAGGAWGYGERRPYEGTAQAGARGAAGVVQASYTPAAK